mmetsp:Transcript_44123/g.103117  ORF Transcript_44123/g.103117 Transcript_44123/m.103117 type:complete len:205 (-) Transcript_44123:19-633(-)
MTASISVKESEQRSCRVFAVVVRDVPAQQPLLEIVPANFAIPVLVDFLKDVSDHVLDLSVRRAGKAHLEGFQGLLQLSLVQSTIVCATKGLKHTSEVAAEERLFDLLRQSLSGWTNNGVLLLKHELEELLIANFIISSVYQSQHRVCLILRDAHFCQDLANEALTHHSIPLWQHALKYLQHELVTVGKGLFWNRPHWSTGAGLF